MPRPKGTPKTGGRKRGSVSRHLSDVGARCRAMVDDPTYQASFLARLAEGKLPPALEAMAWHYAHGKPSETLALTGANGGPVKHVVEFVLAPAHA